MCMREPYGSFVEFISSRNCGGGPFFWRDRWEGFWNRQMEITVRPAKQWHGNKVEVDKDRELLANFQEGETKVKSKIIWFKENILKVEKVFQVWENTTKIRDEFFGVLHCKVSKCLQNQ